MPILLPYDNIRCRPGHVVIISYENYKMLEAKISKGGTVLNRKLHYLDKIQNGCCYFAATKNNSLRKDGLNIIVHIADIISPLDFKKRIMAEYNNGFLGFNDKVIRPYYLGEDTSLI